MRSSSVRSSHSHQEMVYERLPNQNMARLTYNEPNKKRKSAKDKDQYKDSN